MSCYIKRVIADSDFIENSKKSNNLDFYVFLEESMESEERLEALLRFLLPHPGANQGRGFPREILDGFSPAARDRFYQRVEDLGCLIEDGRLSWEK